jgi:hypothetical protein
MFSSQIDVTRYNFHISSVHSQPLHVTEHAVEMVQYMLSLYTTKPLHQREHVLRTMHSLLST